MQKLTLVTGIGPGGWEEYASQTLPVMQRHWPADRFILYIEQREFDLCSLDKSLEDEWEICFAEGVPGWLAFQARCQQYPVLQGRERAPKHRWKPREQARGYSYRYDAAKFSKMAMYAADAAKHAEDGVLVWLDADVMTHRDVPRPLVLDTLRDGADVAYLGRRAAHSETGFVAFQIPEGRKIAEAWGHWYTSGNVFHLPEWHSAYVFDRCVQAHARSPRDLTPGGTGHVWFRGPLRYHADHLKGIKRKKEGISEEWEANEKRRLNAHT